ncbi:DEAD/DEAH box helicase [Shouchella clausii]|uniref:DEAD/DEAH box helicase n=1 Tax=Shouchella clausii TaxID=79880 RepID=UPI00280BE053|nr:DEAD/DEAH box helicase [Shouchella clausii]WMM30903.1 helicase-related protein [Shouchella clausii]
MERKQLEAVRQCLNGRRLLLSELPFDREWIDYCLKNHYISSEPALFQSPSGWHCRRCGATASHLFSSHFCHICQRDCMYCRHCLKIGKVASCHSLFTWIKDEFFYPAKENACVWSGQLSALQQQAAAVLKHAVETETCTALVWAVCGAGKTELLYPALDDCFRLGKRVAIAAPRTDVIKELEPRLKESFPSIETSVLYGGRRKQAIQAQLVLATTHQLMRYYQTFDVLVVDEVDAFPYSYDASLQYAVQQAKKPNATTILLSATPSSSLLRKKDLLIAKIPKRFHNHPLPVPRTEWIGNWRSALKRKRIPAIVTKWLTKYDQYPKMIFLPSIETLQTFSELLAERKIDHAAVYAEAANRHADIAAFRKKKHNLLLTTTILERGVTVENVQVAVLGSEDRIFTAACLTQISGRVGRKARFHSGDIVFWHYGRTKAMLQAIQHIKQMNKEAFA